MIIIVNNESIVFRITNISHIFNNEFTHLYGTITKIKFIDYNQNLEHFINNIPNTVKELTFKNCNLITFPSITPSLEIEKIDLSINQIVGLPNLAEYIHLKHLVLHSNLITNFLSFPPNIEKLDLSNNKIVSIENYPSSLNYLNISSNLILFRPLFLNNNDDIEIIYHNNIFNIIPNNYEESSEPLLNSSQNLLVSENLFQESDFQNQDSIFTFDFNENYRLIPNQESFFEINLEELDNEEIIIDNPYKEITEKINDFLRNSETKDKNIPNEYFCPILKEIMLEPVVIKDGYTYEKHAIKEWFKYSNKSPVTSKILSNKIYINNTLLRNMIREWIDKYKDKIN